MGEWARDVGVIGLALVIGATLVLAGPVGKALAEWIRGWSKTDEQWMAMKAAKHGVVLGGDTERLLAELDELKRRVAETEERLDFTQRPPAKERDGQRPAPRAERQSTTLKSTTRHNSFAPLFFEKKKKLHITRDI